MLCVADQSELKSEPSSVGGIFGKIRGKWFAKTRLSRRTSSFSADWFPVATDGVTQVVGSGPFSLYVKESLRKNDWFCVLTPSSPVCPSDHPYVPPDASEAPVVHEASASSVLGGSVCVCFAGKAVGGLNLGNFFVSHRGYTRQGFDQLSTEGSDQERNNDSSDSEYEEFSTLPPRSSS